MRTAVANLPLRSVRYLESGSGQALIWLHAFPLSADQWLPQLHRVPPGWRFVAPDLRGFRGTGDRGTELARSARRPPSPWSAPPGLTMSDYADDVLELMAHLDIRSAVIGGLSMGGYVALALYRRAPERVAGLVLANTRAAADSTEGRAGRDRMLDLIAREGVGGVAEAMVPKLLGATTRTEQPDLADAVTAMIAANTHEGIGAAVRAMRERPDASPVLASVTCPTTIMASAEDEVIPLSEAEAMHRAIAGSRLVVLPSAGHLSNLEAPLAFNAAVADAL